jgi:type II secretory pathway pseudopilin PulG
MNRKGFSLIELMGIIILLSIISVLVIPSIDRAMRDFKTKAYNSQLQTIRLAANDWSTENLGKYAMDEGQTVTIVLGQLKTGGYLQDELINTKTNEPFPDDMQINIVRIEDTLKYYILDTTGSTTGSYEGAPNIGLNGDYLQRIPIGSVYTELGAYATSHEGVAISGITTTIKDSSNLTVASVNTSAVGEYKIFYSVTNNNLTRTIYRTVVIYDFQEFTLELNGASTISHTAGTAYTDLGAIAYDPIDGVISGNIVVENNVDSNKIGVYYVNYSITNSEGKKIATKRKVIVSDVIPPVITLVGANPFNMYPGTFNDPGATATDNIDGNISHLIVVGGNLTPTITGSYTVTYTVIDSAGNTASVSRTVNVTDSTPPTVVFSVNGHTDWSTTSTTAVTVTDSESGVNNASLKYQWTTSTTPPTEASFDPITLPTKGTFTNGGSISRGTTGTYYLWILAKDNANNTRIISSNVFYVWTAWSSWSTTVATASSTRQVETQLQVSTRTSYSCGCTTCYSCGGTCPATHWYSGSTNNLSNNRLNGTTCQCEYYHAGGGYWYTGSTYAASSYSCGCTTCYSAWSAWSNTASCSANTLTQCQTLYRYRDR